MVVDASRQLCKFGHGDCRLDAKRRGIRVKLIFLIFVVVSEHDGAIWSGTTPRTRSHIGRLCFRSNSRSSSLATTASDFDFKGVQRPCAKKLAQLRFRLMPMLIDRVDDYTGPMVALRGSMRNPV
ncbi:hypothetical protein X737_30410 [Mesorhizobium sp. L48C026A00]|nr:hypothetical protein X737_30410 [Mesorhizobium sp. L48C026A00]